MSWLERLKAHVADTGGFAGNCQNRQNPGSVSFDGSSVARTPSNQDVSADLLADFLAVNRFQMSQNCQACRNFADAIPTGGRGVSDLGWCNRYSMATHPLMPLYKSRCGGFIPILCNG